LSGLPYSMAPHAVDIYVYQRFLRDKMNHAKFIVTECQYNKDYLAGYNAQYSKERIQVQRLGFNLEKFKLKNNVDQESLGAPFRLVSVSRLVEKKGLIYLIDALAVLRDEGLEYQSIIVGEGPELKNLESSIKTHQLGSRVQLLGAKDSDQIKKVLDDADIFILPCIITDRGDRDATPTAIIEAMAVGIPIISTTVAGIPEIVSKNAGILVPPRDSIALGKAIRTVYKMGNKERREMGRQGQQYVMTHCNIESEVRKLIGLFKTCR
jgi:glycosyltransferase involved in cell wall biosynthesis